MTALTQDMRAMRAMCLVAMICIAPFPARAGDVVIGGNTPADAAAPAASPPADAGAGAGANADASHCIDVRVDGVQSYGCVNDELRKLAEGQPRPSSADAPYSATSPSQVTGVFNLTAARERPGARFGNVTTPRPNVPQYRSIAVPH